MRVRKLDRGSVAVELVLLAPVLVALALFVVLSGRSGEASRQVQHAADHGARAASQASLSRSEAAGTAAARADLEGSGLGCLAVDVRVETSKFAELKTVTAHVSCTINHSGLSLLRIRPRTIRAESTEVVDLYRAD